MKNTDNNKVGDENNAPVEDVEIDLEKEDTGISGGVNKAGVTPIIFAQAIMYIPSVVEQD